MSAEDFELPKQGDRLIDDAHDWWGHAGLAWTPHGFDEFCGGYRRAADMLASHVVSEGRDIDRLIFPIMFLYRHYLELRLKELHEGGRELLDLKEAPLWGHSLMKLWEPIRPILETVYAPGPHPELLALEVVIRDFNKLDPNSESFRYPLTNDGRSTLESLRHINLVQVQKVIERAANLLDSASAGICEYLALKEEAEREYGGG